MSQENLTERKSLSHHTEPIQPQQASTLSQKSNRNPNPEETTSTTINHHQKQHTHKQSDSRNFNSGELTPKQSLLRDQAIVQDKLTQQIQNGKLQISKLQTNIKPRTEQLPTKSSKEKQFEEIQIKLKETEAKKYKTIEMLRKLEEQELQIKRNTISFKHKAQKFNKSSPPKKQRSYFSPEDKQKIQQILTENKRYAQEEKMKTIQALKQYQSINTQEQEKERLYIEQQRIKHRIQAEEHLKSLQQKRKEKDQFISNNHKAYRSVKQKKYLHHFKTEKQQMQEQQRELELKQKLMDIRMRMKVTTADEIKEHQNKYEQILKSKESLNGRNDSNHTNQSKKFDLGSGANHSALTKKKYPETRFSKIIKEEIMQQKLQEELANKKVQESQLKVKEFKEHLYKDIQPQIKVTIESMFEPTKRNNSLNSLSYSEQRQKGNQYLSIARKLKKCPTQQKQDDNFNYHSETTTNNYNQSRTIDVKIKHKDYLKEMRRASEGDHKQILTSRRQFAKFLQNEGDNLKQYNSLSKAVEVAAQLESKSKKSNDQKLIESVENKLKLLKVIL